MTQRPYLPILMTTVAALLWASSFTVAKIGLRYVDPYVFVFLRFLVASAVLVVIVFVTGRQRELLTCLRDRYVLLLGITLAASFGFQFRGQVETTAAKAAMIINSSVVLVAPFSVAFLRERMDSRKILALVIGIVGVYLITSGKSAGPGSTSTLRGDLLIAVSSLCYALYVVFTKMAVTRRRFGEIPLIAAVFLAALPIFVIASLPAFRAGVELSGRVLLATGYLAVFCSILPFILWTAAIRHIGALTSAIVLLAELVFGVLIAFIVLHETLPGIVLAGCALVCLAILTVSTKSE
jgi:drug/metabolite transporter (DMT)-like permease